MQTRDKKKERLIVFSTIIGMVVVLFVWGFQLRSLFTETLAEQRVEVPNQYQETIDALEQFKQDVEISIPDSAENLETFLDEVEAQKEKDLQESLAAQAEEDKALNELAEQAAALLQSDEPTTEETQENQEEIIQEGSTETTTQ